MSIAPRSTWSGSGFSFLPGFGWLPVGLVRIETIFVALVILNLVGLTIAAYFVLRKK